MRVLFNLYSVSLFSQYRSEREEYGAGNHHLHYEIICDGKKNR